jgi:uncharacterized protein
MSGIEFHKTEIIKLKDPVVVLGFPGTGLVGSVAASQLVDSLDLKFGGYISSPDFAPLAAIHNYVPLPAARIHYSQKYNLIVILSEMSIPVANSMELADKILSFAKAMHARSIISLGGISLKEEENVVYVVSSNKDMVKDIVSRKIAKPIREGATTGVTGVLLTRGSLENFPVLTILAEAEQDFLDPGAASKALKVLGTVLNIQIDTSELDKDAATVIKSSREKIIKSKISKKGPTAGEGGGMYG